MHICYLCNEYPPGAHGGVGSFTRTLGRAMAARGHRVTAMGLYPTPAIRVENDEGVQVIRLPESGIRGAGLLLNGPTLRRALRELHSVSPIDLIEGPEASLAVAPADFPSTRLIRMHGGHHFYAVTLGKDPRPWRSFLERLSFARATHLCAVSRYVAEKTRELLHLDGRSIEVLPNPVDTDQFKPLANLPEEDGLILFVGTVCEKKGIRQLVQAMPQVIRAAPEASLWVVGRDLKDPVTGGSFTAGLRALIPPDLEPHIHFKGTVEHTALPRLMARAQVCVYPSHMEAMPVAWLEGLAMGKAVVASRIGPGAEVIEEGATGLLCDPHDPGSIAASIIRVLQDPDLRGRLGEGARRRAVDCFSVETLALRNEEYYRHCLKERVP